MHITRTTILKENIEDKLWLDLVLVITYIKNNRATKALANDLRPNEAHFYEKPNLSYVQIPVSIIYILHHKEECIMQSVMWVSRVLKGILVGFNRHIIYRVYIID